MYMHVNTRIGAVYTMYMYMYVYMYICACTCTHCVVHCVMRTTSRDVVAGDLETAEARLDDAYTATEKEKNLRYLLIVIMLCVS